MCLPIVFQQCDFDFARNWHAEAVEEYEEELIIYILYKLFYVS